MLGTKPATGAWRLLALLCLLATGACGGGTSAPLPDGLITPPPAAPAAGEGLNLLIVREASGAPSGVRISWARIDDPEVQGYFIYRDDETIPAGDPTGLDALRVNGGSMIAQSGTGTDTLTFDDTFSPAFGETYFYRMTVVNQTDDESDFSAEESITIAEHTVDAVSQAGGSIGDVVTITGTHFGDTRSGDEVLFTDSSGSTTVSPAAGDYVSWSQTQIEVKIPYGAADGPIAVEIAGVGVLSADEIAYNEPAISVVAPTEDWVQNGYVTLTGADFGPAPSSGGSATEVFFGAAEAPLADIDEAQWTTGQIMVKVPAATAGGTQQIKVVVAGNESNTQPFMVLPHINSASPLSGGTGTAVTITGTNFGATQGSGSVRVRGHLATVTAWGNTSVSFTVPGNATDGNIVLTRDDGEVTNGIGFDVVPSLSSFSPVRREVGQEITITGTGFGPSQGASKVVFVNGLVDGVTYNSWSATQIKVLVPAGAKTGKVRVVVSDNNVGSNLDSADSAGNVAVLLPPPVIDDTGQF